ncbi:protein SSUH2 homolog [Glandiceps talaboti]
MTSEAARQVLLDYASSQTCYGKSAAKHMNLNNIISAYGLHYTLETFSETRQTDWSSEAFTGGIVDSSSNGRPPLPWTIDVTADQEFVDQIKEVKVPHTETIKVCHTCTGVGLIKCNDCDGTGTKRCEKCLGNGVTYTNKGIAKMCTTCSGSGRLKCAKCNNCGHLKCPDCKGYKKLKWFVLLKVNFVNHTEDDVVQHLTLLPKELFRNSSGDRVFQDVKKHVTPLNTTEDQRLNECSKTLVDKHKSSYTTNERIIRQRHTLRAVPVTEIHWTWKSKASRYWVYGYEQRIHCPKYPQTTCYGCNIL